MFKLISMFIFVCLYSDIVISSPTLDSNPKLPEKTIYQLDEADQLFKEFMVKYDKKYTSEEMKYRRQVFEDNLVKINRLNRDHQNTVFDVNPFSDLTFEEFTSTFTGSLGNFTYDNAVKYKSNGMSPDSLDWRQKNIITRVKHQQDCGSCYVFSAVANIEALHARKHGQLIELSEQQGLDCNPRGCDGGWPHAVFESLAGQGCMRESDYPYEAVKKQCRTNSNKIVVRITGGQLIKVDSDEALKDAVASYGPLSVSFSVEDSFMSYRGGVYIPQQCENSQSYHAVLLVGYGIDNGTPFWLLKNSWGTQWGESGYFRMLRGRRSCHLGEYVATATMA